MALSGEGIKKNHSPHSWLAHVFTQAGPIARPLTWRVDDNEDSGKAVRVSVSVPSTADFDRLLLATNAILPLPKSVKRAILASKRPGIWRMAVETGSDTVVCFFKRGTLCALVRQQK